MATDKERRRVASALRKLRGLDYCKDPRYAVELASDAVGADHRSGYSWDKMLARLADLIEPSCDREALLALADCLFDGYPYGLSHGGLEQLARRIREACGEASEG